jgi:hypothetical protein
MALNPSGAISLAGPSTGQSIAVELGASATATISLNDTNVRTLAGVASGVIVMPTDFWGKSNFTPTQKAIFGYGSPFANSLVSMTNLVSSTGVVASDTPGVGTVRDRLAAAGYGGDKAIFGYGNKPAPSGINYNITNLVSNTGVVSSNTPGVGTGRQGLAAAGYGGDKAIFGYGITNAPGSPAPTTGLSMTNLVSNTGVVASDTPGVGTGRQQLAAAGYGGDKAIFGFGLYSSPATTRVSITNLVSNTGVVASDTPGVGTSRNLLAAAGYGGDKAIFGYGTTPATTNITNLVSNTGVVASDTPGVGTARSGLAAAGYGGDKAIFGYGQLGTGTPGNLQTTNLVSNTGVVASNGPGVGTARQNLAAAGYSSTA